MKVTRCDKCGRQAADEGLFAKVKAKRLPIYEKYRLEKPDKGKLYGYSQVEKGECEWELCPMCAAEMLKYMIPGVYVEKERLEKEEADSAVVEDMEK